jgi:CheY-like chemotaxis protein
VDLPPGNYVRINVSDDGSGIPAEMLARVFEPFFSTKADRGGSGLGLAMVRAYAKQFDGAVHIDSVVGKGTTVSLYFPRSAEAVDETGAKTMPLSTLPPGHETVLLMASEENLRTTVGQILEVLGYTVLFSPDARHALGMLRQRKVDLVIIDGLHMEGGAAVIAGAASERPYRVLQLSSNAERPEKRAGTRTLMKPFALAELAQTVRATLDSA